MGCLKNEWAGLKIRRYLVPWGFDSPSRHHKFLFALRPVGARGCPRAAIEAFTAPLEISNQSAPSLPYSSFHAQVDVEDQIDFTCYFAWVECDLLRICGEIGPYIDGPERFITAVADPTRQNAQEY